MDYGPVLQEIHPRLVWPKSVLNELTCFSRGWHCQSGFTDAGRASDRGRHLPKVTTLLDPNPDLTEPPSWPSPQDPLPPRREQPQSAGPPKQAGGWRRPGPAGLGALSPGNMVSWTRLAGKHFESWAASNMPAGPWGSPEAGKVGLCSDTLFKHPPRPSAWERDSPGPESGGGPGRRSRIPERLYRDAAQREGRGSQLSRASAGEAGVAMVGTQRSLCSCLSLQGGRVSRVDPAWGPFLLCPGQVDLGSLEPALLKRE